MERSTDIPMPDQPLRTGRQPKSELALLPSAVLVNACREEQNGTHAASWSSSSRTEDFRDHLVLPAVELCPFEHPILSVQPWKDGSMTRVVNAWAG